MAIIKHKTKSGVIYCYESTPKWDPVHKQARPEKTYLGRWDEETQSIIPTTGKRGRKKKEDSDAAINQEMEANPDAVTIRVLTEKLEQVQEELKKAKEEITLLSKRNQEYAAAISIVRDALKQVH